MIPIIGYIIAIYTFCSLLVKCAESAARAKMVSDNNIWSALFWICLACAILIVILGLDLGSLSKGPIQGLPR